jgi:hypothetical protein
LRDDPAREFLAENRMEKQNRFPPQRAERGRRRFMGRPEFGESGV